MAKNLAASSISVVWTVSVFLVFVPQVFPFKWTSYKSLRQNSSDFSVHDEHKILHENLIDPVNSHQTTALENQITSFSWPQKVNPHAKRESTSRKNLINGDGQHDLIFGEESEEYPSFQDFLDRFSDVGFGFILRDFLIGILSEDREERELAGSLAKVGVVALVIQNVGHYGHVAGQLDREAALALVRFSRYLGFAIYVIGSTYDFFLLYDGVRCLIEENNHNAHHHHHHPHNHAHNNNHEQYRQADLNWDWKDTPDNILQIENQIVPPIHKNQNQNQNQSQIQMQARSQGFLVPVETCSRRSNPVFKILKSVAATSADIYGYFRPEYGEMAAYCEAVLQVLSFLYRQAQQPQSFLRRIDFEDVIHDLAVGMQKLNA